MKTTFSPGSIVFLVLILMCASANTIHSNMLLLLAGIFFAPVLWNFVAPQCILRRILTVKHIPETGFAGEEIPSEIELVSASNARFSCVAVHPFPGIPAAFHLEKVQEFTPQKGETHRILSYSLEFSHRGIYDLSEIQFSCNYPFGLFNFARTRKSAGETTLTIFPALTDTTAFWEQLEFPPQKEGLRTSVGDFAGLRVWTEGDSLRKIHWRASARHGQMMVQKMDAPQPLSVFLIADFTDTDTRNFERNVSLTASLIHDLCENLAPFALGAAVSIRLKIAAQNLEKTFSTDETDDFYRTALTTLSTVQMRDATLPDLDFSSEIEAFRQEFPAPNVLWIRKS